MTQIISAPLILGLKMKNREGQPQLKGGASPPDFDFEVRQDRDIEEIKRSGMMSIKRSEKSTV
jgi:hypothetical protein